MLLMSLYNDRRARGPRPCSSAAFMDKDMKEQRNNRIRILILLIIELPLLLLIIIIMIIIRVVIVMNTAAFTDKDMKDNTLTMRTSAYPL